MFKKLKPLFLSFCLASSLLLQPAFAGEVDMHPFQFLISVKEGLDAEKLEVGLHPLGTGILTGNRVQLSDQLAYRFENLSGLVQKAQQVQVAAEISVYDSEDQLVHELPDLFAGEPGLPAAELTGLTLTLKLQELGLKTGKRYRIVVHLRDKQGPGILELAHWLEVVPKIQHPESSFLTTQRFDDHLTSLQKDLSFEKLYFYDAESEKEIPDNVIALGQKVVLEFEGLDGFTEVDEQVFPGMEVTVLNSEGMMVMYSPDLLASYSEGVDPKLLKSSLTSNLRLNPDNAPGRYLWVIRVFDKKSDHQLSTKYFLEVRPATDNTAP